MFCCGSAQGSSVDHYGNTHCIVSSDGYVQWVPPAQFFVFCDINLRKWPYDEQTCTLQFGSWTYSGEHIHLDIDSKVNKLMHIFQGNLNI